MKREKAAIISHFDITKLVDLDCIVNGKDLKYETMECLYYTYGNPAWYFVYLDAWDRDSSKVHDFKYTYQFMSKRLQ